MAHFILNADELVGKKIAGIDKIHDTLAAITFEDGDSCVVSLKREDFVDYARESGGLVTQRSRSEDPIAKLTNDLTAEVTIVADAYQSYQHTHAHLMHKAMRQAAGKILKKAEALHKEIGELGAVEA